MNFNIHHLQKQFQKNNTVAKPQTNDYPAYFGRYINLVDANDLQTAVTTYSRPLTYFFVNLPEEKADYAYAPGKWTIKDLLQHIIDTERIMSYRLLCIARGEQTALPGFEEDAYASAAHASKRSFTSLKEEFIALRKSTDLLIQSLTEEQLNNTGTASNKPTTANAIGYIIFGHIMHHKNIVEERYL
ncbi:MAG: DinB family protein [Chitinophagaceae bacterium]|nr:DinB family protein [Chitinophagaceae bacterium]